MSFFDFFNNSSDKRDDQSYKQTCTITFNRDSVSMGDDFSGHSREMNVDGDIMLSNFIIQLSQYVPAMKNTIWAIRSNMGPCGYIITDDKSSAFIRLAMMDTAIKNIGISNVYCKYYYPDLFYENGVSKYPDCSTFFEMVKRENEF